MAVRHYIVNSALGFDGNSAAPADGWTPVMVGTSNAISWQKLEAPGPIGRFSRKVLGIPDTHHALIRVLAFGTPDPLDVWFSKSSGDAADGSPILSPRNPPRSLLQNPDETLNMELFPRDELCVQTLVQRPMCIDIAVNDLSEAEYAAYVNVQLLAAAQCCGDTSVARFSVTSPGVLATPTAEVNFYRIGVAPGAVLLPPTSGLTFKQQLFLVATATTTVAASAGEEINGVAAPAVWVTLEAGMACLFRKEASGIYCGVQGIAP